MIPVKLQEELKKWIFNNHVGGVSWVADPVRKIVAIENWLNKDMWKILAEGDEK